MFTEKQLSKIAECDVSIIGKKINKYKKATVLTTEDINYIRSEFDIAKARLAKETEAKYLNRSKERRELGSDRYVVRVEKSNIYHNYIAYVLDTCLTDSVTDKSKWEVMCQGKSISRAKRIAAALNKMEDLKNPSEENKLIININKA
ncbi:hypothetical protein HNO53_13045 [Billgrantia antri]|uniref:Uncharacterized protein n=1 Tax=Halomonas sulfidivorans TaxID=2733488 RepID=A0ABX7WIY2_9GAMM|nr:hypothetical protein [Halomonas sulfidivorans]QTP59562.1 hypothetical protein HNO53_13045 [Halomonas sulfidivorans]